MTRRRIRRHNVVLFIPRSVAAAVYCRESCPMLAGFLAPSSFPWMVGQVHFFLVEAMRPMCEHQLLGQ